MNNLHYGILYRRRPRQYRLRPDILQDPTYSDEEIRQRFRFSRRGIRFIHDLVEVDLTRETQRNHALSAMTQVQSSLRFFASNSVYIVNGDVIGVDKSSVSRVNKAFCRSIVRRGRRFLKFPTTQAEKDEVKKGFYELGGMPSTIGCIDGTHIKIIAPKDNEVDFVNRKGTHSINVQAITDHRYLFLDVDARWPGSAHDSFIFRMSAVKAHLDATHRNVQDGIINSDSGYAFSEYLILPCAAPQTRQEWHFNRALKTTQSFDERSFGLFKRRFPVFQGVIRCCPETASLFIAAGVTA